MGHGAIADRRDRTVRLRRADVRPDPACTACAGTGRFVADWKARSVALPCPRCMAPASAGPLLEERQRVPPRLLESV